MLRRLRALAVLAVLACLAACAAGGPSPVPWSAALPWGTGVALGLQGGRQVGPLAAAAAPGRVAVLDSFGGRVLLWTWAGGRWSGPAALRVPTSAPLIALALAPVGTAPVAAVADGAGGVWALQPSQPAQRLLALGSSPGEVRRVVSLAVLPGGTVAADVVEVTAEQASRSVLLLRPGGPPRTVIQTAVARAAGSAAVLPLLLPPAGVRSALGAAVSGGLWLAAAGPGAGPVLARVGLDGRVLGARPLPVLPRPADFLGVDGRGLAYAWIGSGTAGAALAAYDARGRLRRLLPVPPGPGPALPHPAAVGSDGAAVVLVAGTASLQLRWLPAGWVGRRA